MTAYLIVYGSTPADRLAAYSFVTREAARLASLPTNGLTPRVPPEGAAGGCAYVVENEADVTFTGRLLIDVFNGLTDSGVKKFENREVGVKRLMAILPQVSKEKTVSDPVPETDPPKKRGRASPEGRTMTMAQQMDHYNGLVDQAAAKGLTFKKHTSSFITYDRGVEVIAKIEKAISEAA